MDNSDTSQTLIELRPQTIMQVALLGIGLGILSWVLTLLIRQVIFVPLFCGDPANSLCVGATGGAGTIALIVTALAGLLGLVRLGVYRPLLVALAVAISLWGVSSWIGDMFWLEAVAWSVALYLTAYVAFTWLVRPRAFGMAIALVLLAVVVARLITIL